MQKKEGMYYALGQIKGYIESEKDFKTVNLSDVFGKGYEDYTLGVTGSKNERVVLFDESVNTELRYRIIEITVDFEVDQLVQILMDAVAYAKKNKKDE